MQLHCRLECEHSSWNGNINLKAQYFMAENSIGRQHYQVVDSILAIMLHKCPVLVAYESSFSLFVVYECWFTRAREKMSLLRGYITL